MVERIDRAWISAHAALKFKLHMSCSDCGISQHELVDRRDDRPIGITVRTTSWRRKRRLGARAGTVERTFFVQGHDGECETIDDAIEIRRIILQGEAGR